jgi:hypothetical protein
VRRAALLVVLATLAALLPARAAGAAFGIAPGSLVVEALDASGQTERRAGAHPDRLRVAFRLNETASGVDGNLKDLAIELPPGLVGDPTATPTCPRETFDAGPIAGQECPGEAAVGSATVTLAGFGDLSAPVFNLAPAPDQLGSIGINPLVKLPIVIGLRPGGSGMEMTISDFPQGLAILSTDLELWGIPADRRSGPALPRLPFLTMPTRCPAQPPAIVVKVRPWQAPSAWRTADAALAPLAGCEALRFEPRLDLDLTESAADSPTGARLRIEVPQDDDPDGRATSQLRGLRLSLPRGTSVSPAAAARLEPGSRVGSVELFGPSLREPLVGSVLTGPASPGASVRLQLTASGPGVEERLEGALEADPRDGRLSVALDDLPQVPLERIELRFDGGPGALLATPHGCGVATAEAIFDPHSGTPAVRSTDAVSIERRPAGADCAAVSFAPSLEAGATSARAGRPSDFAIALRRNDGEGLLDRFAVSFPPGLSAMLGSVEPCDGAAAARGDCPSGSRIGSATAELGPGPRGAPLRSAVHLTGPHRGAPFGLALAFPARLGPFDLGVLPIRAALRVDPNGRVEVETDPLPRRLDGVELRLRQIDLRLDRPGFVRNPTSCRAAAVRTTVRSTAGAVAHPESPFFVRGCERLGFRPRASLALLEPRRGGGPGLSIEVRGRLGDANLRGADFALPEALALDPSALGALCSRRAAGNGNCPAGAAVGNATARTPLLRGALRGRVYAVQPHGDGLPDLWAVVRGHGIRLDVRGKTLARRGRLHAKLVGLPDLPMSSFRLRLSGGRGSILEFGSRPCAARAALRSTVALEGHNGAYRILRASVRGGPCLERPVG